MAFSFSTAGGILLAKIINISLGEGKKINPCIGAAGVSAVAAGVFLTMLG